MRDADHMDAIPLGEALELLDGKAGVLGQLHVGRPDVIELVLVSVSAVPLFWLMHHDQRLYMQLGQLGFVLSVGMFLGTQPTLMVEAAPAAVRCTAIALG